MTQYLIMCTSLTGAQRARRLLENIGIASTVVKAPQGLNTRGCGYALSLYRRADEAVARLAAKGMLTGKVFRRAETGEYVEVHS